MIFAWLKLIAAAVIVIGMGAAVLTKALSRSEVRRRVRAAPHELADHSVVTLVGTVRAIGEPLIAPLSGRACVVHRSTARLNGDAVATQCELVRFTLVTRDGDVIVDGETAEIPDRGTPIVPRKLGREEIFLRAHGVLAMAKMVGFEEIVIEAGAKISVNGIARVEITPNAGGEAGFRAAPTIVRLVGDERHPLTIVRS